MRHWKKLNYLLHPLTVIHFAHLGQLALRYRWVTGAGVVAFLAAIPLLYFRQAVVYQKHVYFRVYSQEASVAERVGTVSPSNEVVALINSYDFGFKLAGQLAQAPHFKKLDFSLPTDPSNDAQKTLNACPDVACRTQRLKGAVWQYVGVQPDAAPGRFLLKITTRTAPTTLWTLESFQRAINESRQSVARERLQKQITHLQLLTEEKRVELAKRGGADKIASGEFLDAMILQQKDKIRSITSRLLNDDSQSFTQELKLRESNIASDARVDVRAQLRYETYARLAKRVEELRQNIAAIEALPAAARSPTDAAVLAELREQLAKGQSELAGYGRVRRNLTQDDTFLTNQKGSKSVLEYDVRVSSAQVRKLKREYETATRELDELYGRKSTLDNELLTLRPDLEHLKKLEVGLAEAKFRESAVTSDVQFEAYGQEVDSFKRSSLSKIAIFAFLMIAFLVLNLLVLVYFFDDRIFEEEEVTQCIEGMTIVGYAPEFD